MSGKNYLTLVTAVRGIRNHAFFQSHPKPKWEFVRLLTSGHAPLLTEPKTSAEKINLGRLASLRQSRGQRERHCNS